MLLTSLSYESLLFWVNGNQNQNNKFFNILYRLKCTSEPTIKVIKLSYEVHINWNRIKICFWCSLLLFPNETTFNAFVWFEYFNMFHSLSCIRLLEVYGHQSWHMRVRMNAQVHVQHIYVPCITFIIFIHSFSRVFCPFIPISLRVHWNGIKMWSHPMIDNVSDTKLFIYYYI